MRKLMLTAGAAMVACAFSSVASAQGGQVEAHYGSIDMEFLSDEIEVIGVAGQAAFGDTMGVQVDARYDNWSLGSFDGDVWGLGAHAFTRSDTWLFGAYLGYDTIEDSDADTWTGALETQFYMPNSTVSGVLSHSELDAGGGDFSATMLEGEYRLFLSENFSIHGGLGIGQGEISGTDIDLWNGELGAEYLFTGAPVSIFGFYQHGNLDAGGDVQTDAFGVGVRYNWGGNLLDRNRRGAGLKRVIPVFERFIV